MHENNIENSVKIIVCAHKITKTIQSEVFCPILLGTENADDKTKAYFSEYLYDNVGDNISYKQPNYSELTGLYWASKNLDKLNNPHYIGLFHYRRFFNFGKKSQWIQSVGICFFRFRK